MLKTNNKITVPWLEIPVAEHCNLKCKGCTHHSPYLTPKFYDLDQFKMDLDALKDIYHTNMMIFLGGEPLLCKNINEYLKVARESGIADFYRITTNGVLLPRMNDEFFRLVDEIKVSIYPNIGVDKLKIEALLKEKAKQFDFKFTVREFNEFMSIETEELSEEEAQKGFNNCSRRKNGHLLYNGYYYKCMRPITIGAYLEFKDDQAILPDFITKDGVSLLDSDLKTTLADYINCNTKLESCKYCLLGFSEKNMIDDAKEKILGNKYSTKIIYRNKALYSFISNIEKLNIRKHKNLAEDSNKIIKTFNHTQLKRSEYRK